MDVLREAVVRFSKILLKTKHRTSAWAHSGAVAGAIAGAAVGACFVCSGCITVTHYQPLGGLQRGYAIDYKQVNFSGLTLRVACTESELVNASMADRLCERVRRTFEAQGAKILDDETSGAEDYRITLAAKGLYLFRNQWMWPVSIVLFTLFPVEQEWAIEQNILVTRADGTPVARKTFQARFVWYWGAGYWALNKLFNVAVRSEGEKAGEAMVRRDFSRDYYGNLAQIVYNARASDTFRGFAREVKGTELPGTDVPADGAPADGAPADGAPADGARSDSEAAP